MEKRLRSSLQTSAESFLSSPVNLPLKSAKPSLKTLIHGIAPNSELSASLPHALHASISRSISFFKDSLHTPQAAGSPHSPPTKILRRSSRNARVQNEPSEETLRTELQSALEKLQIYAFVALMCTTHPGRAFSPEDLLPSATVLHDNLDLFESDPTLSSEVSDLCEVWWREELVGRDMLISHSIPFLLWKSLTLKKKVDLYKVYALREAFWMFDFEDESIVDTRSLILRCVISPLYYKNEDGRKFLAFTFGLHVQLLREILAMIKTQIPFAAKSTLEAFGDIVFRGWKSLDGHLKVEMEEGFLQGLVDGVIHASSAPLVSAIRTVLGVFVNQRTNAGVEKLLFRLAEPIIFRSLQAANSNVRKNATRLLLDLFPLEDPDANKEVQDTLREKQFFLLEKLIVDECADIRVVVIEGCCRILYLFWEVTPSSIITKFLTKIVDHMSHDACSDVRISTLDGIMYLLRNPMSHEVLKVLLPRMRHMILDPVLSVRAAIVDLLLQLSKIPGFQFIEVVGLSVLLTALADDETVIARKITRLLMPSYFPSEVDVLEACNRCLTLIKRSPEAGSRFCEFAASEGASRKSLAQLVKVLICTIISRGKLEMDQINGIFAALASLCKKLANEAVFVEAIRKRFSGENLKGLLAAAAATEHAKASLFTIISVVSPAAMDGLVEDCRATLINCVGLRENVERQEQVRSAHYLVISCQKFDDVFASLASLLQNAAQGCYKKSHIDTPEHAVHTTTRKKKRSEKTEQAKTSSTFQDDYQTAIGISWQITELLSSDVGQRALLGSEALEVAFFALKGISEFSVAHCLCYDFVDYCAVTTYSTLSLLITLHNISMDGTDAQKSRKKTKPGSSSKQSSLDETIDHLLSWSEQLFQGGGLTKLGVLPSKCKLCSDMDAHSHKRKQVNSKRDASGADSDGQALVYGKRISNLIKLLAAIFSFITDAATADLVSQNQPRCLCYASTYIKNIIACLKRYSHGELEFPKEQFGELHICLRSSFSYGAKLLYISFKSSSEDSPHLALIHDLSSDLLNLISGVEIYCNSTYAAKLVTVAKEWLHDLVLGLVSYSMLKQHSGHRVTVIPSWLKVLANIGLEGSRDADSDEEAERQVKFPAFKKLGEMVTRLLAASPDVLDGVGAFFVDAAIAGLKSNDLDFLLGVLNLIFVKIIRHDSETSWEKLRIMAGSLRELYTEIETEIAKGCGEERQQELNKARALIEPAWEHICEE